MNQEINEVAGTNASAVGGRARNQRQQGSPRISKRPAPTTPNASPRKQQLVSTASGASQLSFRNTPAPISMASRVNETTDNPVAYRVVQLSPSDNSQRQPNVIQPGATHILTTNNQGELVANSGQQIIFNSTGGLTFATAVESSPTRLYVPGGAISVTGTPATISQPVQLQSFDTNAGSYYIMLSTGSEIVQATPAPQIVTTTPTAHRVIAAPRIQQAAFIPLSRLEPAQAATLSNVATAGGTAHVAKETDFQIGEHVTAAGNKDVKRRVSHNEVEKRRRDKINNWISKLARVVPDCSDEIPGSSKASPSKGGVLARTVDFIQELRDTNEQLLDTVRHYDSLMNCLKDENKQLRTSLQQAGIEAPPALNYDFSFNAQLLNATADVVRPVSYATTTSSQNSVTAASSAAPVSNVASTVTVSATPVTTGTVLGSAKGRQYVLVQTKKGVGIMQTIPNPVNRPVTETEEPAVNNEGQFTPE